MEDGTTTGSVTSSAAAQQAVSISNREKQIVLWLNNINHAMNHFQNQIVFVMYPTIAREMGFEPLHLSLLTAGRSVFNNWAQLGYGFITPLVPRFQLLGHAAVQSEHRTPAFPEVTDQEAGPHRVLSA